MDTNNEETSYLNASDEEIMNMGEPDFSDLDTPDQDTGDDELQEEIIEDSSETNDDEDEIIEEEDQEEDEETLDEDSEENEYTDTDDGEEELTEEEEEPDNTEEEDDSSNEYKKQLDELFAPFKANSRELQVSSVDEARRLMQMGANYAKKMAALKPHLRLVKTMENHNVSEQDLSFFIDLKKKDPTAIARFLKDSNIDPLDLDLEKGSEYQPQTYTATDEQVELSQTLSEMKELPGFNDTLDIVGNKWDSQSRQVIKNNPHALRLLQAQVADGTYQKVMAEVEKQRIFGNLDGVSDIEAYDRIGSQMFGQQQESHSEQAPAAKPAPRVIKRTTAKKSDNPDNKRRKKAASLTGGGTGKRTSPEEYNPLELSDEDFDKLLTQSSKFI